MRTGYRLAVGIAGVTIALAAALAIAEAFSSDRDAAAYGQIPVPGRDSINLPQGNVIMFYGERRPSGGGTALAVPPNLTLLVRSRDGTLLGSSPYGFAAFQDGDYVRRPLGRLNTPSAGSYEVITRPQLAGADEPVISFGRTGTRDFGYVLFVLAGGLLLAAILAIGTTLVARRERP
jgi:hypothetical protein